MSSSCHATNRSNFPYLQIYSSTQAIEQFYTGQIYGEQHTEQHTEQIYSEQHTGK